MLSAYCVSIGEKPFRANQLMRWIHQNGESDFDCMTDISMHLRAKLKESAVIQSPLIVNDFLSGDGTRKWLIDVGAENAIETVFIPEADRGTLCISSQAGCAVNCYFCSTGKQGFNRNLKTSEIIGQLRMAEFLMREQMTNQVPVKPLRRITNVVMMGMGEPLLNYDAVLPALKIMLDDNAYGISKRRLTLSTSGVVPMIDRLAKDCPVALAISLHASNDELRNKLVPLNKKYPLNELLAACDRYLKYAPRDFITFEYCMLQDINDSEEQAKELIKLMLNFGLNNSCKFNLIPFNPFPNSNLKRSKFEKIKDFAKILSDSGIVTTIRKTRGDDINAACGQLAGDIKNKTRISVRKEKLDFSGTNSYEGNLFLNVRNA